VSIFSSIGGALKGAVTGFITGGLPGAGVGAAVGVAGSMMGGKAATTRLPAMKPLSPLPGVKGSGGGIGGIVGGGIAAAAGGARKLAGVARGAAAMCAKYPQWCLAAGGVAAIANMMHSGQLPVPKRRRRRGITPHDLASFRRVATLIKSYGPTARRVPSSCAPRKSCKRR